MEVELAAMQSAGSAVSAMAGASFQRHYQDSSNAVVFRRASRLIGAEGYEPSLPRLMESDVRR